MYDIENEEKIVEFENHEKLSIPMGYDSKQKILKLEMHSVTTDIVNTTFDEIVNIPQKEEKQVTF